MQAELLAPPAAFHAEGPVWWPADGSTTANTLRYVDMMAGRILTVRDGEIESLSVPGPVAAAFRPRARGGICVLTEFGVSVSGNPTGGQWVSLAEVVKSPEIRFNDGGCDPDGNLYCGTMRYDQAAAGAALYRVAPDGVTTVALDGATISNGIAWSPSGELAYYNDTPTRSTWVFDWSSSTGLTNRRRLYTLGDSDPAGGPDGLCVDAAGNVWTAIYGGARVECRDGTSGALLDVVELPVTNITACTFGGDDLRTLFITTTRENVPAGEQPDAGAVFCANPGVSGLPVAPFAG